MKILLQRLRVTSKACDGAIYIRGNKICDTAERMEYAVPEGLYRVELRHYAPLDKKVPVLISDMPWESKMTKPTAVISIGNGIYNCRDARIIVGTALVPGCLKWSRKSFMKLYHRINKALQRGQEVTMLIS